ncbi:hypothetical protein SD70_10930 [Gordoniibacillus kamchatkensis]|uniref:Major facilitator superfamily (MFS) profile domain-containing protein n=1 Tax=Gordoniibacillus kamchatkensis TaxID=1590651 RepID=A0ABR5AJK5_9BACL|nr:hypothetical protein SD70_10930 [Paenibacillus sp. VKM B-2647]
MSRQFVTLLVVCVTTFMLPLDYTIVSVALHDIQATIGASYTDLQWIINGYTLTFAVFLLTGGALSDLFGRRKIFMVGLVVFSLASLLCGIASDAFVLNVARAVQGIGAALMFSAALPLLVAEFEGPARARAFGIFGAVVGIGAALGPFLGGIIINALGWRWAFLVNVPVGVLMLALTLWKVAESRDPNARGMDWGGFATFTIAATSLVYTLISGNEQGWGSPVIMGSIVATVVFFALFVVAEKRHSYPMFDLSLFKNPTFVGASIPPLVLSISFWGIFLYFPTFYQGLLEYSPFEAGLAVLPFAVPLFIGGPLGAKLALKLPAHVLLSLGEALVGLGCLWMLVSHRDSTWVAFAGGSFLSGLGAGLINGEMTNVAMSVVPAERSGMASGINSTMRQVGIALGFAGLGAILAQVVTGDLSRAASGFGMRDINGKERELAATISTGDLQGAITSMPAEIRSNFAEIAKAGFFDGLHAILLVSAIIGLAGAIFTFVLIRKQSKAVAATKGEQIHGIAH